VGNRRLLAMKNFLQGGSSKGLSIIAEHPIWVSDYKFFAISDQVLSQKWFWIGSSLPKDTAEILRAAADPMPAPKGMQTAPMLYDTPLTVKQLESMLTKGIAIFESQTNHVDREDLKARYKPNEETRWPC
jgi:hypothetical protein